MKKLIGLALAVLLPGLASAQYSNGPFTSTSDLQSYWNVTSTGGARAQIYVNGRKVFDRAGFGPAFVKQYFDCYTGDINAVCTQIYDGYVSLSGAIALFPSSVRIDLDGSVYRAASGGDTRSAAISTCSNESSANGPVNYYKVVGWNNGFIPYSSSCYP